jgi:hypothetical protein
MKGQRAATLTKLKYFKVSVQPELRRDEPEIAAPAAQGPRCGCSNGYPTPSRPAVFLDRAVPAIVVAAMPEAECLNHQGALA